MTSRAWRFFTHPLARAAAIIGVPVVVFMFVMTLAEAIVMIVSPSLDPLGSYESIWDEGGRFLRQAVALYGGAILLSVAPGLLLLSGAILIECAARFTRAAGVAGRPGLFGFFTHGAARFIAIAALLYLPLWLAVNLIQPALGDGPGLIFLIPPWLTFATTLLLLAVIIEYLSRIADALGKPGALGVDEDAGG